jgi:hypothetical protein
MSDNNLDMDYRLAKLELKNELREELVQIINKKLNNFESKMLKDTTTSIQEEMEEMNVEEIIAEAAKEAVAVSTTATPTPAVTETATPTPAVTETSTVTPAVTETSTVTPAVTETPAATPAVTETPAATPAVTETPAATPAVTETPAATPVAAAGVSGNTIVTDTEPASEVELAQAITDSNATDAILEGRQTGGFTRKKRNVFTAGGEFKRL